MKKYAKIDSDGYIIYTISSPIPQEGLVEVGDIPPPPSINYSYNIDLSKWVEILDINNLKTEVSLKRNKLLAESDWTQLPDVPLTTKQNWAAYRQALRDITTQSGYPTNVMWPEAPQA